MKPRPRRWSSRCKNTKTDDESTASHSRPAVCHTYTIMFLTPRGTVAGPPL